MIELAARQRHYRNLQTGDLVIRLRRLCAQGTAKLAIKIIFFKASMTSLTSLTSLASPAALREQRHSTVREHPHTDIRQKEMIALQFGERLDRRFLKHLLQHGGRTPAADEDAMVLGHRGIEPEAVADDIRLRDGLQRLCGTDEHIATDYHRMDMIRRCRHHLLIKRQLYTQQIL